MDISKQNHCICIFKHNLEAMKNVEPMLVKGGPLGLDKDLAIFYANTLGDFQSQLKRDFDVVVKHTMKDSKP